jgi:Ca2+-transporting ATPase
MVVLFINFLVQIPIAVSLGFDKASPGLMERKPRPLTQPVLSGAQWVRLIFTGLLVAIGTLIVEMVYTPVLTPEGVSVAATMGFVVFSMFNIAVGLSSRSEIGTIFTRDTVGDRRQLQLYGLAIFLMVFGAEFNLGQRILGTVSLTGNQWFVCIVLAFALILIDEVVKFFMRRARSSTEKVEVAKPAPQPA